MRHFEQKDYSTIADGLGCSEAAARSHVSKAVATLKRKQEWKASIMRNRKIQLIAAAVIVVVALLGLHRLGAPLDGTTVV